jgi:sarcosine/dimethylglycine N-methyltransferase
VSTDAVRDHYGTAPLWDRVQTALAQAGLDGDAVQWSALAPLDEFHTRGLAATRDLARALGPRAGDTVLDVGSGLGGPARLLAAEYGCEVTGVDLTPEFVEVANRLTERSGLTNQIRFQQGDATRLAFPDGAFDHAWTQHVAMNIADRARLYAGVRRVLKPGGRFAVYDVVAGDGEPLRFPVPWSRTPETSFLLTTQQTLDALGAAGFAEVWLEDQTAIAAEWFAGLISAPPGTAPAIGLPVVMGPDFPQMAANLYENLASGRAGVVALVVRAL